MGVAAGAGVDQDPGEVDAVDRGMRDAVSALVVVCDELAVFAPADAPVGAGLAARVRSGGTLALDDARAAWRLLQRYRDHTLFPPSPPLPPGLPPTGQGAAGKAPPVAGPPPAPAGPPAGTAKLLAGRNGPLGLIGISAGFKHRDALRMLPGRAWDKKRGLWTVPATPAAAGEMLSMLPTLRCSPRVQALADEYARWPEIARYIDPAIPVPTLDFDQWGVSGVAGKPLWEHQQRSALFLSEMSAALLAVTMGGGKSGAVVTALNRAGARRVLIACPDKVLGVWPKQFRRHSPVEWHIDNGRRTNAAGRSVSYPVAHRFDTAERLLFDCPCGLPHAVIVNYEVLIREPWASWLPVCEDGSDPLDVVVYDEGHRLGRFGGNDPAVAAVGAAYSRWISQRWATTGTPMPQSPLDVYHPFRALDRGIFGNTKTGFSVRYAERGGYEGKQVIGLRNPEDLARRFFQITYMPSVDLDLPPSVDVTLDVELEPEARALYDTLERQTWADVSAAAQVASGVEPLDGEELTVSPPNAPVLLMRLQQLTGGTLRMDNGELVLVSRAKSCSVGSTLAALGCCPGGPDGRSAPEPVVIFTRFVPDLDALAELAEAAGLRYGEVSGRRSDLTSDATMPEDVDLLGVQMQSGGTGIDLTRAAIGGFFSLGYSLSDYLQARARILRPGQTRPVRFLHWLVEETNDIEVYAALEARQDVIAAVLALHGIDASLLGLTAGEVDVEEWNGEVDGSAVRPILPAEIAAFAPNARVGSPASGARGRGSVTRAARQQYATIVGRSTDGGGRRRNEIDDLMEQAGADTLRMYGLEGL